MSLRSALFGSRWRRRACWAAVLAAAGFALWFWRYALPDPLFDDPYSAVLEDRHGALLSARIAADGQWRFPPGPAVPEKYRRAVILFEDKRFERHPGVDPLAVLRALRDNLAAGSIRSGASTLTMQTIRLARKNRPRTLAEKAREAVLALRLELAADKDEILALYAAHAPFGGNVVGLEAAAWRYFGRPPRQLSWAETAMLAVAPNAPALMHPGRNREALRAKRDRLLRALREDGAFDETTLRLALAESLPHEPAPLPDLAPHLLDRVRAERAAPRLRVTVDRELQIQAARTLDKYHRALTRNGVHNGAALILDNETGGALAYLGNMGDPHAGKHEAAVDVIPARRSTGSLLKPFLHAAALQEGRILPRMLLRDLPADFGGFRPRNFDFEYEGAVPAGDALARSRNVPAVMLQRDYGTARFHGLLRKLGMSMLDRPPSHYGLSLILGGAESSLWELAGMYRGLACTLNTGGTARQASPFQAPDYDLAEATTPRPDSAAAPLARGAVWHTLEALTQVERPESQGLWRFFSSSRRIAWKTGTSFGFRDAWAIGVTPRYTVAVWVGNADGEGRPGLTGVAAAAPLMFELFRRLPAEPRWFVRPDGDLVAIRTCARSGYRATERCAETRTERVPETALQAGPCPHCRWLFLDPGGPWQVHSDCMSPADMTRVSWFTLPPDMAWRYRQGHADYRPPPPFRDDCSPPEADRAAMALILPKANARLYIPIELDGAPGRTVFEAAHREPAKTIHWHLDQTYLGSTRHFHQMALRPAPGDHVLTLVDEDGATVARRFKVLETTRARRD